MTPKNEATPRPWVLADYGEGPIEIHADFGHAIATMTTFPTRAHQRIDATLIVTAVNAYDAHRELVEAAKLAADLLTDIRRGVAPPEALRAAGFRWGSGSWVGERAKLPLGVVVEVAGAEVGPAVDG